MPTDVACLLGLRTSDERTELPHTHTHTQTHRHTHTHTQHTHNTHTHKVVSLRRTTPLPSNCATFSNHTTAIELCSNLLQSHHCHRTSPITPLPSNCAATLSNRTNAIELCHLLQSHHCHRTVQPSPITPLPRNAQPSQPRSFEISYKISRHRCIFLTLQRHRQCAPDCGRRTNPQPPSCAWGEAIAAAEPNRGPNRVEPTSKQQQPLRSSPSNLMRCSNLMHDCNLMCCNNLMRCNNIVRENQSAANEPRQSRKNKNSLQARTPQEPERSLRPCRQRVVGSTSKLFVPQIPVVRGEQ
jgi:hypothetical protein